MSASRRPARRLIMIVLPLLLLAGGLCLHGCASTRANRDAVGETFPSVVGESLDGKSLRIPGDLAGKPAVLIVGYVQKAQFDADRWLLGLIQGGVRTRVLEVPTIEGLMPGLFSGSIDDGMRRGIPNEDWASVVTVYGDASKIVDLTGNENPNNVRVLLLDAAGKVVWQHDRGYSASKLVELKAAADRLERAAG